MTFRVTFRVFHLPLTKFQYPNNHPRTHSVSSSHCCHARSSKLQLIASGTSPSRPEVHPNPITVCVSSCQDLLLPFPRINNTQPSSWPPRTSMVTACRTRRSTPTSSPSPDSLRKNKGNTKKRLEISRRRKLLHWARNILTG